MLEAFVRVGLSAFSQSMECVNIPKRKNAYVWSAPRFLANPSNIQIPFHPFRNESRHFCATSIADHWSPQSCKCKGSSQILLVQAANNQYWRHHYRSRDTRKASAGCRVTLASCGSRGKGNATRRFQNLKSPRQVETAKHGIVLVRFMNF